MEPIEEQDYITSRLAGLSREQLRELAFSALKLSDGPFRLAGGDVEQARVEVVRTRLLDTYVVYERPTHYGYQFRKENGGDEDYPPEIGYDDL